MHEASMKLMEKHLHRQWMRSDIQHPTVLDVGSYDVNGSYRELCESHGMSYTGLDLKPGPNVDVVSSDPYHYPLPPEGRYDVVICGNMLHMTPRPWRVVSAMAWMLKPHGLIVVVTVWKWGRFAFPNDYFRVTAEGLRVLFDEMQCLTKYQLEDDDEGNTAGSAVLYG